MYESNHNNMEDFLRTTQTVDKSNLLALMLVFGLIIALIVIVFFWSKVKSDFKKERAELEKIYRRSGI